MQEWTGSSTPGQNMTPANILGEEGEGATLTWSCVLCPAIWTGGDAESGSHPCDPCRGRLYPAHHAGSPLPGPCVGDDAGADRHPAHSPAHVCGPDPCLCHGCLVDAARTCYDPAHLRPRLDFNLMTQSSFLHDLGSFSKQQGCAHGPRHYHQLCWRMSCRLCMAGHSKIEHGTTGRTCSNGR